MTLQSSCICIDNLHINAQHGVMEQERAVGATFVVSLRVHYNIDKAMQTDDVADTLSYADMCHTVMEQMAQPSRLLEHAAGRICQALFRRYPQATAIDLRLCKKNPPMGADCDGAAIEIHVTNEHTHTCRKE